MNKMKEKFISQSMYKDYADYLRGNLCGLVFIAKWLDQDMPETEMTEPQAAGWWFEDMVVRGKSDINPPELKKGGFNALYRNLDAHIPLAKEMLREEGEIISTNETHYRQHIRVKRDVVVLKKDKIKVIDIKTTGHLDNKWDFYGWGALGTELNSGLYQREHKLIQANTYMCVPINGRLPDEFEYWVFSSKDDKVMVLSMQTENPLSWATTMEETLRYILEEDFQPKPSMDMCSGCPLKDDCMFKSTRPKKIVI